ncbi:MAG TPA: hypothetical protein VGG95_14750 [Edaphobacter sp.]|jgi:hypothetical protein
MNSRNFRPGRAVLALTTALFIGTGCNKHVDNTIHFTDAINTYYSAHPVCLWDASIKFPVQAATSDTSKTSSYDALVDQGLLARTTAEKKVMIVASKQVNNYDLSEKGRSAWIADVEQPGFGNFCYGHRKVSSIDSSTPTSGERGATTQVAYHYTIAEAPAWATAEETQNAFPQIRERLSGPHTGNAVLIETNEGWKVARPGGETPAPTSAPSGK